jgi:hypothetical protein
MQVGLIGSPVGHKTFADGDRGGGDRRRWPPSLPRPSSLVRPPRAFHLFRAEIPAGLPTLSPPHHCTPVYFPSINGPINLSQHYLSSIKVCACAESSPSTSLCTPLVFSVLRSTPLELPVYNSSDNASSRPRGGGEFLLESRRFISASLSSIEYCSMKWIERVTEYINNL